MRKNRSVLTTTTLRLYVTASVLFSMQTPWDFVLHCKAWGFTQGTSMSCTVPFELGRGVLGVVVVVGRGGGGGGGLGAE